MSLCDSIDTLSMAFLDDELAAEERRELELHLTECASCRAHVDGERIEKSLLRKALAGPPAPDLLRARLARALDEEDRAVSREERRRWTQWMLPGSAMLAGAAAIAAFVAIRPPSVRVDAVASEAVRQQTRALPLEVQGASTRPWVEEHFPSMPTPEFTEPGVDLLGARASAIYGHDAVMYTYRVNMGRGAFKLGVTVVDNVRDGEIEGDAVQAGDRVLYVSQSQRGAYVVSYIDSKHREYMFIAPELSVDQLVQLVASSDLDRRN